MEEAVEQLLKPIELDDADLEIVAGGLQNNSVNFNNFDSNQGIQAAVLNNNFDSNQGNQNLVIL
jgi:hypothetical protein